MAMKIGLNELFKTIDFLDDNCSYLERMGALYYQARFIDQSGAQNRFRKILELPTTDVEQELLLRLHSAIILAQHGEYEGIDYILNQLHKSDRPESIALAETSLRNCNQFPLAVLLGQALVLHDEQRSDINTLLRLSDDDLFGFAETEGENQDAFMRLNSQILGLANLPRRPGRELAIGTVLSRPVNRDRNYRYSGFVVIDQGENRRQLVVPYGLGDVLNRDDQHAHQDVFQLTRRPGRRAIVVYNTASPYEAQQIYILPFECQSFDELSGIITRLAIGADGLQIGVAVEIIADRGGYRVITANGQCRWETFKPERKKRGSCVLIHELNSSSLSSDLFVSEETTINVTQQFKDHNNLPKAVLVYSDTKGSTIIGVEGKYHFKNNSFLDNVVYFTDKVIQKDDKEKIYTYEIPGLVWTPTDRARVVIEYFKRYPDTYGVVIDIYTYNSKQWAQVVRLQTGEILIAPVNEKSTPGSLALCDHNSKDNRVYTTILPGYRIQGGCSYCFGTSKRICSKCNGYGYITCPDCDGEQLINCPEPNCDNGVIPCAVCSGNGKCKHCTDGYWRNGNICPICSGTGKCQKCKPIGSGKWSCGTCHGKGKVRCNNCNRGSIQCPDCKGTNVIDCACGGKNQGFIIAV